MSEEKQSQNVLDSDIPMSKLILKYSIPGIMSGLVSALYNIVDQVFIGQSEGMLGNAATNVAFPLVSLCASLSLLFGIGGAANFSIAQGRKDQAAAKKFVGASLVGGVMASVFLSVICLIFLDKLLWACGATEQNYQLARDYTGITAMAIPFFMFSLSAPQLIRADGSPKKAMQYAMAGAILNIFLDAIFIFGLDMGIKGAAYATLISQVLSGFLCLRYFFHFKTFPIEKSMLIPDFPVILKVASLGLAPATNQFTLMITQIVMNNTLTHYGALSEYGSDIPMAVVGVVSKVVVIYMAFAVGLSFGAQPIVGYHFGAGNHEKVMKAYKINAIYVTILSVFVFFIFQLFPRQILNFFGDGSEAYFQFGVRYFRVYMAAAFLNGFNPITANFLTSIGKAKRGMVLPFSKQIIFMLPMIVLLPSIWGIDGVLLVGPFTDIMTFFLAMFLITSEFKSLKKMLPQGESSEKSE